MAESNVYGYIQFDRAVGQAYEMNRECVAQLPESEDDRLLWRGMFNISLRRDTQFGLIHFAASYDGIEYEWEYWISQFQRVLQHMNWDTATVHLETLYSGKHTFNWENDPAADLPDPSAMQVRCQWTRESSFA